MARRLVEAGVPWVTVFFNHGIRGQDDHPDETDEYGWDTHNDIFESLKTHLLPRFDHSFSALLEDLHAARAARNDAGGVHGRVRPRPAGGGGEELRRRGSPGRKHWAACYSVVLAGAGVVPGPCSAGRTGSPRTRSSTRSRPATSPRRCSTPSASRRTRTTTDATDRPAPRRHRQPGHEDCSANRRRPAMRAVAACPTISLLRS